ncbi:Sodium/potassium-transporting ATPase subunit beta-1-interacting protein 4 [Liparis tanakae]|uniref:Sodium/potassium-transporting ATPase subunit beta-1-interacting protein n=1 Tax=Liparis tanakae TaxID=230148 RepID=A0A4Z2I641_9TELE|nr:Sodium/potassium-transporting ATPase subunit beta-1-interacting protein 4 [Liparis tanakae]
MLILLCCLQLVAVLERQVFDFLGYQWAPIMINFFHIIAVILGLFGVVQYRSRYVVMDSDVLSLGVSSHRSWWKDNGPGCEVQGLPSSGWQNQQNQQNQQNPEQTTVLSCWLEYQYIEILHCIVQLLVSVSLRC